MANQKASINNIQLGTQDICLNKFKSGVKPYQGFLKNNSPFYGNVLSPFWGRTIDSIGANSYVAKDGTIYSLVDGDLTVTKDNASLKLSNVASSRSRFITREQKVVSGNSTFSTILGFFQDDKMLCTSDDGSFAIVNSDGTVLYNWSTYKYTPSAKVHFTASSGDLYCFAIGNDLYVRLDNGNLQRTSSSAFTGSTAFGCRILGSNLAVCAWNGENSDVFLVKSTGFSRVRNINIATQTFSGERHKLFFDSTGNVVFLSANWQLADKLVMTGDQLKYVDDTTLEIQAQVQSSLPSSEYKVLSTNFSNTSCSAVVGLNSSEPYRFYSAVVSADQKYTKTEYVLFEGETYNVTKDLWVDNTITPRDEEVTLFGGYIVMLLDADNQKYYTDVPLNVDGSYAGGTYATLAGNVRALYHGGTLQGLSIANDTESIGTMLCMMSEIDVDAPITVGTNSVYFKDMDVWNVIGIENNPQKATLKVLSDMYLLVNTTDYYNCFSLIDRKWYHYGSDWNDRAVFSYFHTYVDPNITTLEAFSRECEIYYFASAQAANYEALGASIISTIFPSYPGLVSKNSQITCKIPAGCTPNNQDIDCYAGKNADYGAAPMYFASYDNTLRKTVKYTDSRLDNTNFAFTFTLTPSIFAEFVQGFVNQGIVVDGERSYLQVYANNVRPIFAINFSTQLEGITNAFIIQGQYYVFINGSIYRYTDNSIEAIVNTGGMQFVGNDPYMALFWSTTNRTFYRFTGDNQLVPVVQADEIESIRYTAFNPNTLSIYVITDKYVLILSQDNLIKLPYTEFDKCYPLINGVALTGANSGLLLSYNKLDGYEIVPIELETALYGLGNSVKSVNDCVYIRLFDEDMKAGKVELRSQTLNESSRVTQTKVYNITKEMWDKQSKTIFLRYQPQNQAATGFGVYIKSPFAIASLQIGSTAETVQNSKHNV